MSATARRCANRLSQVVRSVGLVAALLPLAGWLLAAGPVQAAFSYDALNARLPIVRQHSYIVNAKVRPLLFWIGRDNIGDARLTWREAPDGRRGFELMIGSDPARAPRRINRWGFIVEELGPGQADVFGLMKESNEQTMRAAEAQIARQDGLSVFKVIRTTIVGDRAVSGSRTLQVSSDLTYRNLDSLLALIPPQLHNIWTLDLPAGTQKGFLVSMDSLLRASAEPCRADDHPGRDLPAVPFVYGQTLYDLSLLSCRYEAVLKTTTGTFAEVVEGRFEVKNRVTKYETKFRVFYGASGELAGLPVRVIFRPRWWMELELLLDRPTRSTVYRADVLWHQ